MSVPRPEAEIRNPKSGVQPEHTRPQAQDFFQMILVRRRCPLILRKWGLVELVLAIVVPSCAEPMEGRPIRLRSELRRDLVLDRAETK